MTVSRINKYSEARQQQKYSWRRKLLYHDYQFDNDMRFSIFIIPPKKDLILFNFNQTFFYFFKCFFGSYYYLLR